MNCNICRYPIGLCACKYDDYGPKWAFVQSFRRECYPEAFSPFMLSHVVIDSHTVNIDDDPQT